MMDASVETAKDGRTRGAAQWVAYKVVIEGGTLLDQLGAHVWHLLCRGVVQIVSDSGLHCY